MEMTVGEAQARFAEAVAAAERGERVILTRDGAPVIELVAARPKGGVDFEKLERISREMGWEDGSLELPPDFDDPAFSRRVLGLED